MSEPLKIAIVVGAALLLAAFINGGRYMAISSSQSAGVFVVDRFTGTVYVNGTKLVPFTP